MQANATRDVAEYDVTIITRNNTRGNMAAVLHFTSNKTKRRGGHSDVTSVTSLGKSWTVSSVRHMAYVEEV